MMHARIAAGATLLLLVAAMAPLHAQAPSSAGEPPLAAPRSPEEARQWALATMSWPDPLGSGPFPVLKEVRAELPGHVVYRPRDMDRVNPAALGLVVWGNGGCGNNGAEVRFHLLELASRGYIVIAPGKILSGPGIPLAFEQGPERQRTTVADLRVALDGVLAENTRAGSAFFGKINPQWVAASGWSCGALQALQLASDSRVRALVLHNSGVPVAPTSIADMQLSKEVVAQLRLPVLYILGGESDSAYRNGMDDFGRIQSTPAFVASLPVGHGGTFFHPNGGRVAQVAAAWLDWQLRKDALAGALFTGSNCGLCRHPDWTVSRKNFD